MKSLLKLTFIFFALLISFCINPQADMSCDAQTTNYIQTDYKKVAMVSNPIRGGEVLANEAENHSNSINNNELATELNFVNKCFSKNTTRLSRESIHNLSTNEKQKISIRAP